jgi:hypothetical protein
MKKPYIQRKNHIYNEKTIYTMKKTIYTMKKNHIYNEKNITFKGC